MFGLMRSTGNTTDRWMVWTLSNSADLAQRIESTLRNQGHPVRLAWMADIEELERALQRQVPQVLLIDSTLDASLLSAVTAHRDRWAPDTPIVHCADEYTHQNTKAALQQGASALVSSGSVEALGHLELEIVRQLQHHLQLRELRNLRLRLQQFERRHTLLLADTQDAILRIQEGIVVESNHAALKILRAGDEQEVIGSPLMNLILAEEHARVKGHFKRLYRNMDRWDVEDARLECTLTTADHTLRPVRFEISASEYEGAPCLDLIIRSSTATGPVHEAASVTSGREALSAAIEDLAEGDRPTLMMLAIDRFENLEKQFGYLAIDALMEAVEQWLQSGLEDGDVVFRTGTSEWLGLLRTPVLHQLSDWLEQLVTTGNRHLFQSSRHETHLAIKAGVYALSEQDRYSTALNTLVPGVRGLPTEDGQFSQIFGDKAGTAVVQRSLKQRALHLEKALADDSLRLAFLPITSLQGDSSHLHDVLVRMVDPSGTEQTAGWFIEAARQHQLITQLDRWVARRVLTLQFKRENTNTPPLIIKLGEHTVHDAEAFLAWLQAELNHRKLEPGKVIFGLRESEIEKHIGKAMVLARGLRALGADVAIEHFGVSPHAHKLLGHLPVQYAKLAPHFNQKTESGERFDRMKDVVELIHQHKVKSIVSHVNTAQAMAQLWQLGVNYVEGSGGQEPEVVLLST